MRDGALPARPTSDEPAINCEEEAFEVLHHRAQIRLNLYFGPATVLGARQVVVLFRLGEQPLALPHPFRPFLVKRRVSHLGLHVLEQVLIKAAKQEALGGILSSPGRAGGGLGTGLALLRNTGVSLVIFMERWIWLQIVPLRTTKAILLLFIYETTGPMLAVSNTATPKRNEGLSCLLL